MATTSTPGALAATDVVKSPHQKSRGPRRHRAGAAAAAAAAASPLPHVGGFFGLEQRRGWREVVKRDLYRCLLVIATAMLVYAIVWLQSKVGQSFATYNVAQRAIQWGELIWLAPVPLSVVLWIGWFIFAEPKQPSFLDVPLVPVVARVADEATEAAPQATVRDASPMAARRPVRLVLRYVTRGDNVAVLEQSLASARVAFATYPGRAGEYALEVVTERPLALGPDVRVVVVPPDFVTPARSRFKARALRYLQLQAADSRPEDWHVYLDEESGISAYLVAGVYEFIARSCRHSARGGSGQHVPRVIGQGGILYQGGHWFFRGADALRTADDFGRFRVQYALGMPLFGIHGSYIVTPELADRELSFDVGYDNSITEDAAWGLRAWAKGWRFGWVRGCVHEQPPQRALDFLRQRARWLSGIRLVLRDGVVPLRYRACLGVFTLLWQLSFLPFAMATAGLIYHVLPFAWMRIPADYAWAVFVLAYVLGADVQAKYSPLNSDGTFQRRSWARRTAARLFAWAMAINYIWYALLEAAAIVYSVIPRQGFFVIKKPALASGSKGKRSAAAAAKAVEAVEAVAVTPEMLTHEPLAADGRRDEPVPVHVLGATGPLAQESTTGIVDGEAEAETGTETAGGLDGAAGRMDGSLPTMGAPPVEDDQIGVPTSRRTHLHG